MSIVHVDLLESDDDSIIELIQPSKPAPIVVDVDIEEEIIINISKTPDVSTPAKAVAVVVRNKTPKKQNEKDPDGSTDVVSPYHWTNEMRSFYNDDWGGEENFVLEDLLNRMPTERKFWNVTRPLMRSSKVVCCFSCNRYHTNKHCHSNTCHMCGTEGHLAARCPQRMCLTCGKKARSYTSCCPNCRKEKSKKCSRCSVLGHSVIDCTDNWRRFHNTTSKEIVEAPAIPAQKRLNQIWCCNCGRQGHIEVYCRAAPGYYHSPSSTLVTSYDSAFNVDKAGGLDFRKKIIFEESESPNLVQPPPFKPTPMKRKRYFVMPSDDDDDVGNKRHKNNDGTTTNFNNSSNTKPRSKRKANKSATGPTGPTLPQETNLRLGVPNNNITMPYYPGREEPIFKTPQLPPKKHNYKSNVENITDVSMASRIATGPIIYYKPSTPPNSSTFNTRDEHLTLKRQKNTEQVNFSTINHGVAGSSTSSSNAHITPKRKKHFHKNPFAKASPSFIPLESKQKRNKKKKKLKKKANKNNEEPMEKIIYTKTLIGEKHIKKKTRKEKKALRLERQRQQERKLKKMQLNQNRPPFISPGPSKIRPSINPKPVQNERGAIQRWNNYLLGV